MGIARIYWAARNLGAWWNPFGNHHFALIETAIAPGKVSLISYRASAL